MARVVLGALLVVLGAAVIDVPPEWRQSVGAAAAAAIVGLLVWERGREGGDDR